MSDLSSPSSRTSVIAAWVLRVAVAALFLFAAFAKLSGQTMMVDEFGKIGLGQGFRVFTGSLELIGAVAVLVPRSSVYGAVLLLMVDLGAFVTQLFVLHGDVIHTIVIGLVIGALIYLQRHSLPLGRSYRPENQL